MTRIPMLFVVSGTLVAFALTNGASAFTLGETTPPTPKVTVHPPVKPNVSGTAKVQGLGNNKNIRGSGNLPYQSNVPAVQSQQK
jgi:hypothetical protein